MIDGLSPDNPELKKRLWPMFRQFFRQGERKRRWNVDEDIPWDKANKSQTEAVAAIIESFCAVELYLPDYVAKALPMIRTNRAWAWTHINWGYEEAKHSIALGDWLLKSGHRTESQMADLEDKVFAHEWNLPQDSAVGMLVYAMVQELATWLSYRNLRNHILECEDPTLFQVLTFVQVDERAHYRYYSDIVKVFLDVDRKGTIDVIQRVLRSFTMPAMDQLADTAQVKADVRAMKIFDEDIFYQDVYLVVLETLAITRAEMRDSRPTRKSQPLPRAA